MNRLLAYTAICTYVLGVSGCSNTPDFAPAGSHLLVLCSSCIAPGQDEVGENAGVMLLDQGTGDIWVYNDAALAGTAKPTYVGKLTKLGEPVTK